MAKPKRNSVIVGRIDLRKELDRFVAAQGPSRVARGLRNRQTDILERLAGRTDDEFAQLLAKGARSEAIGGDVRLWRRRDAPKVGELRKLANEKKTEYVAALQARVAELRKRLRHLHPFGVLARVASGNLLGGWGTYFEPEETGSESKVEFVAGLLATQAPAEHAPDPPQATDVQGVFDDLAEIFDLAFLANIAQGFSDANPADVATQLRVRSRMHTMTVRGDSYVQHARDLARAIYGPLSPRMRTDMGFVIDDVISMAEAIVDLLTERTNALLDEARAAAEALRDDVYSSRSKRAVAEAMRGFITAVETGLTLAFTFTREDLVARGIPSDNLDAMLRRFSLELGSIEEAEFRSPLDVNPLVSRPILRFGDCFALPIPGMLARDYPTLLEPDLLQVQRNFSKHRARVLDELAIRYLERMVPGARTFTHLTYEVEEGGEQKRAEVDGLVIWHRSALVVEGKGTGLSMASRRGDVLRLRRDIERAVEEAWRQGARARDYLLSGADSHFVDEADQEIVISAGSVDTVYIVNPTVHALADHAVMLPLLRKLGLFPCGEMPWSVFINDLRIIAETVRNPAEFLHYLAWRSALPLGERVSAIDELDVFGSYLLREQIHERLVRGASLVHLHSTVDFDAYYFGEAGDGPPAERPSMFSTPLVDRFIERLCRQRPDGWLDAAGVCLDLSLSELAAVDAAGPRLAGGVDRLDVRAAIVDSVAIVAIGTGRRWGEAYREVAEKLPDTCRVVIMTSDHVGQPRLVWALERAS